MEEIFVLCPCRIGSVPESLMVGGRGPAHRPGSRVSVAGVESFRSRVVGDEAEGVGKV